MLALSPGSVVVAKQQEAEQDTWQALEPLALVQRLGRSQTPFVILIKSAQPLKRGMPRVRKMMALKLLREPKRLLFVIERLLFDIKRLLFDMLGTCGVWVWVRTTLGPGGQKKRRVAADPVLVATGLKAEGSKVHTGTPQAQRVHIECRYHEIKSPKNHI